MFSLQNGQDHLEASLSQLVLEDNDELTTHKRSTASNLSHSNLVVCFESPHSLSCDRAIFDYIQQIFSLFPAVP